MSARAYSTKKSKSPLFDSTSSDLFDDLVGKLDRNKLPDTSSNQIAGSVSYKSMKDTKRPLLLKSTAPIKRATAIKVQQGQSSQTTRVTKKRSPFVPKESSPPVVVGSAVEARKRVNESSRSVSRYNYSYSPRSMEKRRAPKRPAPSKVTAKSKLKVYDFDFGGDNDDVLEENQLDPSSEIKVQRSKAMVTNPPKAKFNTDQSDLRTSANKSKTSVRSLPVDCHGNSAADNPSSHATKRGKASPLYSGGGDLFIDQITMRTPSDTDSPAREKSPADTQTSPGSSQDVHKSPNVGRDYSCTTASQLTSTSLRHSAKKVPTDLSTAPKVGGNNIGTLRQPSTRRIIKHTQPRVCLTEEVKGQIRGTKRVKPDMPNVADIFKSKVEEIDDSSLEKSKMDSRCISGSSDVYKSGRAISEIATRTRSTSKAGLKVMSPLDELLESPAKKSRPSDSTVKKDDVSTKRGDTLTESPVSQIFSSSKPSLPKTSKHTIKRGKSKPGHGCVDLNDDSFLELSPDLSLTDSYPKNQIPIPSLKKSSSSSSASTKPPLPSHKLTVPGMSRSSSWPRQYSLFSKQTDSNEDSHKASKPQRLYSYINQSGGPNEEKDDKPATSSGVGEAVKGWRGVSGASQIDKARVIGVKSGPVNSPSQNKDQEPTRVRNVRQAHQCLVTGEYQEFFDEVRYLLGSIKPSEPLNSRCLGTLNLATQFLSSDFSQQLRSQGFTNKIITFLKDCLKFPTLCLCTAVLFYVITRDKLNSDMTKEGTDVLVGMLSVNSCTLNSDLSAKAEKEMKKIKLKSKSILEKVVSKLPVNVQSHDIAPESQDPGQEDGGNKERKNLTAEGQSSEELPFRVDTDDISVSELARETLTSLSSPHNNPHTLREQLRITGALDTLANMVISCSEGLPGVISTQAPSTISGCGLQSEEEESIEKKLWTLDRNLKILENCSMLNKDNQGYLVVFDGSVLVSRLTRLVVSCRSLLAVPHLKSSSHRTLLYVYKLLLNITHDNELGAHRVGEQTEVMEILLDCIFKLPSSLSEGEQFDIIVLTLGLLINLTEHSSINRRQLESAKIKGQIDESTSSNDDDELLAIQRDIGYHGNDSSLRAFVGLFLKHYSKAESASIEVPSPQRLSQLSSSSPHSSPYYSNHGNKSSLVRRDLTPSFANRLKGSRSPRKGSQQLNEGAQGSEGMDWLPSDKDEGVMEKKSEDVPESESESDEEYESIATDPLVFSRVDVDTALHQAGQHLQDSVLASYAALLIGLLVKHNHDNIGFVKDSLPSKSFSELIGMMKKFVSFMNMTGSTTGLDSIRHIIKYLEAL